MPRDRMRCDATGSSPHQATELSSPQLSAVAALVGGASVTAAARGAGGDRATRQGWLSCDAAFVATLNLAKQGAWDGVGGELGATAADAVKVVRELMTSADAPPALRLRAALALLGSAGGLEPDPIGPTDPEIV